MNSNRHRFLVMSDEGDVSRSRVADSFCSPKNSYRKSKDYSLVGTGQFGGGSEQSTRSGQFVTLGTSVGLEESINRHEDHILSAVGPVGKSLGPLVFFRILFRALLKIRPLIRRWTKK